jgi:Fur family ferric uptake transcriptional regulator
MRQPHRNLVEELQARGMRVTPQRAIIFDIIETMEGHITAEEIFQEVQNVNSYISLATVYRTLELLQELNLITPTNLGGAQTYFAMKDHGSHHHLVCQVCGAIEEFTDELFEPLRLKIAQRYNFEVRTEHMSIFGVCAACRQNRN